MGRLTTHVLDTARGCPAAGVRIELMSLAADGSRQSLAEAVTNSDGRCDSPLLEGAKFAVGKYELIFHAGAYLKASGPNLADPLFLDDIAICFGVSDADADYHVPLLLSPYGYSTYRGS